MSTPTNYATLQTEIANVLARTDLTSDIPTFIKYGEVDLNNRLRIRELISTTNINPSATNSFVPLPTGFLELISFNDNYGSPLQEVGYEKIADLQYGSGSGKDLVTQHRTTLCVTTSALTLLMTMQLAQQFYLIIRIYTSIPHWFTQSHL